MSSPDSDHDRDGDLDPAPAVLAEFAAAANDNRLGPPLAFLLPPPPTDADAYVGEKIDGDALELTPALPAPPPPNSSLPRLRNPDEEE